MPTTVEKNPSRSESQEDVAEPFLLITNPGLDPVGEDNIELTIQQVIRELENIS